MMRETPNFRYTACERPVMRQRRVTRVGHEFRGSFAKASCTSNFSSIERFGSCRRLRSSARFSVCFVISFDAALVPQDLRLLGHV